jgi:hypothetical protein
VISDDGQSFIGRDHIENFKKRPYYNPDPYLKPKIIMLCLDTNNDGENEMAMIAMANMHGCKVVSLQTKDLLLLSSFSKFLNLFVLFVLYWYKKKQYICFSFFFSLWIPCYGIFTR